MSFVYDKIRLEEEKKKKRSKKLEMREFDPKSKIYTNII